MAKRKNNGKSKKSNKRSRTTKTSSKYSKSSSKSYKRKDYKKKHRRRYKQRPINVKQDTEKYTKSFCKTKVTKQQQKLINRRFRNGYSPFQIVSENQFQDTIWNELDKCKWIWRKGLSLSSVVNAFNTFPIETSSVGATTVNNNNYYYNSADQTIYFNSITTTYEITNPTDYDMNLCIYDIVCKEDTDYRIDDYYYNYTEKTNPASISSGVSYTDTKDPIRLIYQGTIQKTGVYSSSNTTYTTVADPTNQNIWDISIKPTNSYPFNIYWKIVKKHTYRLQPGASMTHKFIHKPKQLINRGYFGYKYAKNNAAQSSNQTKDIGIKELSSGCLFKYWGQVTGTGDSSITKNSSTSAITGQDHNAVYILSGRLMFKEYRTIKWYVMDKKYNYVWYTKTAPTSNYNEESLEVVNNTHIQRANAMDIEANNTENSGATTTTTNP
ncbi:hypothetical protein BCR32DRAFT_302449 [Anaeromyces robustus]|uniref:Uncharacterized protein n=1 Tax=Anaeromyces robustus TaxID=1754192 RepID=A0A1Y1WVS5_9FUNG|nr:hypothetical protein BCR32DRAFT_302449 [Anaeromyces robustus]|eukprot:ORX77613.1 hypothetical protein BCR32DRAFT_302449 [Anaeromyces robustus]